MTTEFFRKYINIINEAANAVDPGKIAEALSSLSKYYLGKARQAKADGDERAAKFEQAMSSKTLSLVTPFQRGWAEGFKALHELDQQLTYSNEFNNWASDVIEWLEASLKVDWIYDEYHRGEWKKQKQASPNASGDLVAQIRARLSELHDTMEPEDAYDQVADEFNITGSQLEKLLQRPVKEESDLSGLAKQHGMDYNKQTYGAELKHPTKGTIGINRYGEWNHYPAGTRNSAARGNYEDLANYLQKLSSK